MGKTDKIVISASRRTDIPAFYINWFMGKIEKGFFHVTNPYNRVTKKIDVSCSRVDSIVFWSKNFRPFLESGAGTKLIKKGYNLFFNFTVNSRSKLLEPKIPSLDERFAQMEQLCDEFTPAAIHWRFDPICFYKDQNNVFGNNLSDFALIAEKAEQCGITRCITSFADDYAKIRKRVAFLQQKGEKVPTLIDPGKEKKIKVIKKMEQLLNKKNISLFTCCEKELFSMLPEETTVSESSCIPGKLLQKLFKGNPVTKRDYGQRSKMGCRCTQSVDIGSYDIHPCFHNCLFCYANPEIDSRVNTP
ncbi:MAG: DUF1848 family protein [Thermodesulfobacteriota bacterium]|nr:DUF1848 family protein [Thermodesulfobacteriota bacterium]